MHILTKKGKKTSAPQHLPSEELAQNFGVISEQMLILLLFFSKIIH